MTSRHQLKERMLTELSKSFNIREASQLVAYYFDAKDKVDEAGVMEAVDLLRKGVPIQYVCEVSFFYGYKFILDRKVLIPRPETEELVHWVVKDHKMDNDGLRVLDIGSGSGCIILSILKSLKKSSGVALDIDKDALDLVSRNAIQLDVKVESEQMDILNLSNWNKLGLFDIIVSNPPYITEEEYDRMGESVKKYEPREALFVTDNDPLQFYRLIMQYGFSHLTAKGEMYFETSDLFHDELESLVKALALKYEFRRDMQGNWRMLKVWRDWV